MTAILLLHRDFCINPPPTTHPDRPPEESFHHCMWRPFIGVAPPYPTKSALGTYLDLYVNQCFKIVTSLVSFPTVARSLRMGGSMSAVLWRHKQGVAGDGGSKPSQVDWLGVAAHPLPYSTHPPLGHAALRAAGQDTHFLSPSNAFGPPVAGGIHDYTHPPLGHSLGSLDDTTHTHSVRLFNSYLIVERVPRCRDLYSCIAWYQRPPWLPPTTAARGYHHSRNQTATRTQRLVWYFIFGTRTRIHSWNLKAGMS